jgi:hypothetical protein
MAPHPYRNLAAHHFWRLQVSGRRPSDIDYDAAPKFVFDLSQDCFATAGSCFAQHFGRELDRRGGRLCITETRHPLMPSEAELGYGLFSARYGNIYTTRQLRELVDQVFALREPIFEWAQREDGRWVDMLRPTAVSDGYSSPEEARADRVYHLDRARAAFLSATVLVFTFGLTEGWENAERGFVYPICPGTAAGEFDERIHRFKNLSYPECLEDMQYVFDVLLHANPELRVLLTVSPVMLVASFESRGALQSSVASKSVLRAVAEACRNDWHAVDYFPAYEIVSGPQAEGRFYDASRRDVSADGVAAVMDAFFASRFAGSQGLPRAERCDEPSESRVAASGKIEQAIAAECDELLLDPGLADVAPVHDARWTQEEGR